MSEQAFTHPQQVRDLLASTIGEDVFNQIEAQDPLTRVGNPLPPPADPAPVAPQAAPAAPAAPQATPAPAAAAAPADTTAAPAPDGQPGGKEKLVLGKYKTDKEAEDAYHRLLHANKELMRERDALKGTATPLADPSQAPASPATPRQPAQSAAREEAIKRWQDKYGVDPEDFAALETLAKDAVKAELAPERERAAADAAVLSKYPEIATFRDEIVQFVATDPEANAIVQKLWDAGDIAGAMEVGYLKFDIDRRMKAERAMLANDAVRQEEVAAARKDAGLIGSQVSGVHETTKQFGPSQEDQRNLEALYRAGHKEPWLRANIGASLPDDLFGVG